MWKLNAHGHDAVLNAVSRKIKFGMKAETWLEDAEEEANRAWDDPEWTPREAELDLLAMYCKDGRPHVIPLYPGWFDWVEPKDGALNHDNFRISLVEHY